MSQKLFGAIGLGITALIYIFRVDYVIGQFVDDAWYLVLAKSIAESGTYQLISSPIQGLRPIYPPGFPLILAFVMKVVPEAMSQLWILKYVSILAMAGAGFASYKYYTRILKFPEYISYICTVLLLLSPAFVFAATSTLMSECVFTCFVTFTLVKLEIAIAENKITARTLIEIGLLTSYSFYIRSAALIVFVAIIARLFLVKQYGDILKLVSLVAIGILPWVIYSNISYPNNAQREFHGGTIVSTYFESLQMNAAGDAGSGNAGINDYFWRVGENVKTVLERDMVGFILPSVIRGSEESGTELLGLGGGMKIVFGKVAFAEGAKWFSIFFSAIILIGIGLQCKNQISSVEIALGLTLILAIIWPWYTFRFILPFLPFLISYFVISLRAIPRFLEKYINIDINEYIVVRVLLICLLCFFIIEHSSYINAKQRTPQAIGWIADFDTVSNLIENINTQLPAQSLIASTNPAQIFLLTGHQGISVGLDDTTWEYWRRAGLRYVVNTKPTMPITGKKGDKNDVIYQASDLPNIQIVDLGETQHLAKLDLLNPN